MVKALRRSDTFLLQGNWGLVESVANLELRYSDLAQQRIGNVWWLWNHIHLCSKPDNWMTLGKLSLSTFVFSSVERESYSDSYFKKLLWEINDIIHVKRLVQPSFTFCQFSLSCAHPLPCEYWKEFYAHLTILYGLLNIWLLKPVVKAFALESAFSRQHVD